MRCCWPPESCAGYLAPLPGRPTSFSSSSTRAAAVARATAAARVDELLKLVGLPGSGAKFPAQLSGGQQQRIALARALATSPGLLLLDEPLSALDALERVRLRGEIRSLQRKLGVTTIMVTHDQEEALSMADRIVVMNHGVIEQVGTPMEVYRDPATPFVADFVGKINVLAGAPAPGRATCASARAASPASTTPTAERDVKVYLRPEDVLARPIAPGDANVFDGAIDKIEFLGSYCLVRVTRRGDRRAADHRLPVAQLPRRAGPRGRQPAAAEAAARADARSSEAARSPTCPPSCRSPPRRAAPARALDRPRRPRRAARDRAGAGRLPRAAAGDDPRQGAAGHATARSSASPTSRATSRTPALLQSFVEQRLGRRRW